MFWQAVFPACSYAEVQKEGTEGHDPGSGSREERPPGVFTRLGGTKKDGLRALVSWSDGCRGRLQRELVVLKARPACGRVMGSR